MRDYFGWRDAMAFTAMTGFWLLLGVSIYLWGTSA